MTLFHIQPPTGLPHLATYQELSDDPQWGVMLTECGESIYFVKREYKQMFYPSYKHGTATMKLELCEECRGKSVQVG